MSHTDHSDRHVSCLKSNRFIALIFTGAVVVGALTPLKDLVLGVWDRAFPQPSPGLRVVEVRVVNDPWEAGRLVREVAPDLADSIEMVSIGRQDTTSHSPGFGGRWVGKRDSFYIARFPMMGQFPEIALVDVVLRNTSPAAAAITRVRVRAEKIRGPEHVVACHAMPMTALYHVRINGDRQYQETTSVVRHRIGGEDVERIGLLIGQDSSHVGGTFRINAVLQYNGDASLILPPFELVLERGCGGGLGRPSHTPIRLPYVDGDSPAR